MDLASAPFSDLLDSIAARTPSPGGGAVASALVAIGAALAEMVVNYSLGKEKYAEHMELHEEALAKLVEIRATAMSLAAEDARAYEKLADLQKLDKGDPKRVAEWSDAVRQVIEIPRRTIEVGVSLVEVCEQLSGRSNRMLRSDLAIACVAAEAAVRAGAWNVRVNLPLLDDHEFRQELEADVAAKTADARERCTRLERSCLA